MAHGQRQLPSCMMHKASGSQHLATGCTSLGEVVLYMYIRAGTWVQCKAHHGLSQSGTALRRRETGSYGGTLDKYLHLWQTTLKACRWSSKRDVRGSVREDAKRLLPL